MFAYSLIFVSLYPKPSSSNDALLHAVGFPMYSTNHVILLPMRYTFYALACQRKMTVLLQNAAFLIPFITSNGIVH